MASGYEYRFGYNEKTDHFYAIDPVTNNEVSILGKSLEQNGVDLSEKDVRYSLYSILNQMDTNGDEDIYLDIEYIDKAEEDVHEITGSLQA